MTARDRPRPDLTTFPLPTATTQKLLNGSPRRGHAGGKLGRGKPMGSERFRLLPEITTAGSESDNHPIRFSAEHARPVARPCAGLSDDYGAQLATYLIHRWGPVSGRLVVERRLRGGRHSTRGAYAGHCRRFVLVISASCKFCFAGD